MDEVLKSEHFRTLRGPQANTCWQNQWVITLNLNDGTGDKHFHKPYLMDAAAEALSFLDYAKATKGQRPGV